MEAFVPLLSAYIGGGLTLFGVAYTVNKNNEQRKKDREELEEDRRKEEIKKAKPIFTYEILFNDNVKHGEFLCTFNTEENGSIRTLAKLVNSDQSNFFVRKIFYNTKWFDVRTNNCIIKNQKFYLLFSTKNLISEWTKPYIVVELEDMLNVYHYYKFNYIEIDESISTSKTKFNSLHNFEEISKEEMENLIKVEQNNE